MQHAVDTKADTQPVAEGFDMNIRCARFECVGKQIVHQTYNGGFTCEIFQLLAVAEVIINNVGQSFFCAVEPGMRFLDVGEGRDFQ